MNRPTRFLTAVVVLFVAAVAGVVSFSHIYDLGVAHGQAGTAARLLPLSVDGLILASGLVLLHEARSQRPAIWQARLGLWSGIAATVTANVLYGARFGLLGALLSGWPAFAFIVAAETMMAQVKRYGRDVPAMVPVPASDGTEGMGASHCPHGVACSADEAVVNAYLHGRDCLGVQPSQRQLSAGFGLSRTKVAALVGPLNGHQADDDAGTLIPA